jgi:hypothetical protein
VLFLEPCRSHLLLGELHISQGCSFIIRYITQFAKKFRVSRMLVWLAQAPNPQHGLNKPAQKRGGASNGVGPARASGTDV